MTTKTISVTYLRDLAQSYRDEGQSQTANDLISAADSITALRTERDQFRREHGAAVRVTAKQVRELSAADTRASIDAVAISNRDERIRDLIKERGRLASDLHTTVRRLGYNKSAYQSASTLLEQAQHECDALRRDRDECAEQRDDHARRLVFLRMAARDQAKFAGIKDED